MKFLAAVVCTFTLVFCSSAFADSNSISTPPSSGNAPRFVDLDGDGLHDLMTDSDNDGIPDKTSAPAASAPIAASTSGIFAGGPADFAAPPLETHQPHSVQFNSRYSLMKCLAASRGGFGSGDDFGPGNGIGIGNVSGGHCVGGVCF